jgi:glycosyltransferase involved in cell wall biosynthesis
LGTKTVWTFKRAKELGVKTVLVPNFEFLEFLRTPSLPKPDLFLVPSVWRMKEIEQFGPTKYLHFPVDRKLIPLRKINWVETYLHNVGNPAVHDRNGTRSILDAMKLIDNPNIKVFINGPTVEVLKDFPIYYGKVDKRISWGLSGDVIDYWHLYDGGSILLLPRRYGGNCLPMNEALSAGMPVIMTDISPQNTFLPKEWLVPAIPIDVFRARTDITVYEADPKALAEKMEWFYNLNSEEMLRESKKASALADTISWTTLLPEYTKIFEDLVRGDSIA